MLLVSYTNFFALKKLRINVPAGTFIGAFIDFIKEINRITLTNLIKLAKKRADIT